jgi:hypothetical protein
MLNITTDWEWSRFLIGLKRGGVIRFFQSGVVFVGQYSSFDLIHSPLYNLGWAASAWQRSLVVVVLLILVDW